MSGDNEKNIYHLSIFQICNMALLTISLCCTLALINWKFIPFDRYLLFSLIPSPWQPPFYLFYCLFFRFHREVRSYHVCLSLFYVFSSIPSLAPEFLFGSFQNNFVFLLNFSFFGVYCYPDFIEFSFCVFLLFTELS